jgi:hypothetical protein
MIAASLLVPSDKLSHVDSDFTSDKSVMERSAHEFPTNKLVGSLGDRNPQPEKVQTRTHLPL